MKFKLEMELGNSALEDCYGIANLLREISDRVKRNRYPIDKPMSAKIMDVNGNSVGSFYIEEDSEDIQKLEAMANDDG